MRILLIIVFLSGTVFPQVSDFEKNMERVYINAKKGIYYALANIPGNKNTLEKELIENDVLISKVKLSKEVNGLKLESTGYYSSYEIKITAYRSYDNLLNEGILKQIPENN
ncbi:MAG: hypothetical protein JW995_09610 [Melioribacteraceae bacterium]|nr:hypothetical protein [Melioribacteraceae bacterium]